MEAEPMTTLSAISSSYAGAVRRSATAASADPAQPVRAVPRVAADTPRKHELFEAMNQVLKAASAGQVADDEGTQSVLRFAHALMHDLRTLGSSDGAGEAADGGGASAWGDLPERLSTLATAAAAPAPQTTVAVAEMPDEPNPVTTATAAVHIMKVPSSRLLEAFVAMHRALGQLGELQAGREREALADLARRLSGSVHGGSSPSAGAVVDVKA
jgi:hypothetical protein